MSGVEQGGPAGARGPAATGPAAAGAGGHGAAGAHGGSEAIPAHGSVEHLVQMANDIGNFFRSEPERKDAIAGIANHIAKYWTVRMRQKLLKYVEQNDGTALDELPREAVRMLATAPASVTPAEPPGGDAG